MGCIAHKKQMAAIVSEWLEPIREKRSYYDNHRNEVEDIIEDGNTRARKTAREVMGKVKEAMHMG